MAGLKIAIMVHNLRMGIYEGMEFAARMGVPGVHLACVKGFTPGEMDLAARRQLVRRVKDMGLEISAICAWGGNVDLGEPENLEKHIEEGKKLLEFAADLECGIWQGHCGIIPHTRDNPKWARFVDSFGQICRHGEKVGARLAVETGPEPPEVFMEMIADVKSPSLKVNYDPANLILWPARYQTMNGGVYDREKAFAEYKPVEGVKVFGKHIIHTHAKDAKVFPDIGRKEVPLGEGWIDWPKYVGYLREIGYDGYYAIEREVGNDPVGDITRAIEFLRTL
ncbi:MAG TPA: sugar phosphate isomerase/epimerase family protein [Lentisphaeria bacterium]|nr:sugar phosphate isomerase/epimerase [Lentisphaerota bacterium]OQC12999.1 MAG: L-ribulose-5-phosphate 3-epimerase UlaE [Lentisphaerae bacterium ADurb.Bin082]HPY89834.1 sugar phosphate isomerase/epimerase family protein [Lentisphaeria bacterium]HQC52253.1 sugar phosphate isomerase/epimerase family protein [Lentisphaeria bacterium]HQL87697.1 sugar phosphate isomerase/epimerase family protein [Lentisphaeria bacterium]